MLFNGQESGVFQSGRWQEVIGPITDIVAFGAGLTPLISKLRIHRIMRENRRIKKNQERKATSSKGVCERWIP